MMTFLLSKSSCYEYKYHSVLFFCLLLLISNSFIIPINGQDEVQQTVQDENDNECTIIGYQLVIPTQDISSIEYTMLDIYGRDDVEVLDDKYIVCTSNTYGDTIQAILSPNCFTNNNNSIAVEFILRNVSGATIQYYNTTSTNRITNRTTIIKNQRTILPIIHQSIQTSYPYYLYGTNTNTTVNNKTTTTVLGGKPSIPSNDLSYNYYYSWPPGKYRIVSYIVNQKNTTRKSINFEIINCAYYRAINECPMKCPTTIISTISTISTPTVSPTSKPTLKRIPTRTTKKSLVPTKKPFTKSLPTKNLKPILVLLKPSKPITTGTSSSTNITNTTRTTKIEKVITMTKPIQVPISIPIITTKPIEIDNDTTSAHNKEICEAGMCIPTGMLRITLISYGSNTWDYNINITSPYNTTISTSTRKLYIDPITGGSVTHNTMYMGTCKSNGIWIKNIIYPKLIVGTYSISIQDINVCQLSSSLPITNNNNNRYYKLKVRYNYNTTIIPKRIISIRRFNNTTTLNTQPKLGLITTTSSLSSNSNNNGSPILHKYRFKI